MINLVGICGAPYAGKDSTARAIKSVLAGMGVDSAIYSFADPIKLGAAHMLGISIANCYSGICKESKVEGFDFLLRDVLQTLGTDWGRSLDPDIWVKLMEKKYKEFVGNYKNLPGSNESIAQIIPADRPRAVIVPDVRFYNEVAFIKNSGGKLIRVTREGLPEVRKHESESYHSQFNADAEIANHGSLGQLYESAEYAIRHLILNH